MTAPGLWLQRITTKPPATIRRGSHSGLEGAMALEESQVDNCDRVIMQFVPKLEQLEKRFDELTGRWPTRP